MANKNSQKNLLKNKKEEKQMASKNINKNLSKNKKEDSIMEKQDTSISKNKIYKMIMDLSNYEEKLKMLLNDFEQPEVAGDMRTPSVKKGDYFTTYLNNYYLMDELVGIVRKIEYVPNNYNRMRARIVAEFQNGIKLSFYAYVDNYIKKDTLLECVGIVLREGRYYNFKCLGGCRRIISSDEFNQLKNGKPFEDITPTVVPTFKISTVRVTKPLLESEDDFDGGLGV